VAIQLSLSEFCSDLSNVIDLLKIFVIYLESNNREANKIKMARSQKRLQNYLLFALKAINEQVHTKLNIK
jgi:hypothetical protein